ncbi:MAG: amino acid permease [Planctomycetes bacterium]|nr:amino acid permease [Planctomycetota bacterium]MCB9919771.1 amino acid permease [Planctomycetota bacterium]
MSEERRLGTFDATMLVMGGMIGVGIFFTPSDVARALPTPTLFLGAWTIGAIVALCGAFTFAELGASIPKSGGWFVFLHEAFGRFAAFLFAWTILGVTTTAAVAVICDFAASFGLGLVSTSVDPMARFGVAAALVVVLNGLALSGLVVGARFQNFCMLTKLIAIAALLAGALAFALPGSTGQTLQDPTRAMPSSTLEMIAAGLLPVFFSYGGWQNVCYVAPAVRDPVRSLPRAILIGTVAVGLVYIACNVTFVLAIGVDGLASNKGFSTDLAQGALGSGFERALRAAMTVSAVGVALVTILVCPDLYVATARAGLFFRRFERRHPRTGAPVLAIVLQTILALAYLTWAHAQTLFALESDPERMDPDKLLRALVFAEWIFHAGAALALLQLRRRGRVPRPFRMPLWPIPTLVYLGVAILVVVANIWSSLYGTGEARPELGLGVLAAGAVTYFFWQRRMPTVPDDEDSLADS